MYGRYYKSSTCTLKLPQSRSTSTASDALRRRVRGGGDDLIEHRLVRQLGQIEVRQLPKTFERLADVLTFDHGAVARRDRRDVEVLYPVDDLVVLRRIGPRDP